MKRDILLILGAFFIAGCGGGIPDNINAKQILTKNSWYEICSNNSSRVYHFYDNYYTRKSYNDDNFTDLNKTKQYQVEEYSTVGFTTNNSICAVSNVLDLDNNQKLKVQSVLVECLPKDENDTKFQLFMGWKNKELARENKGDCF